MKNFSPIIMGVFWFIIAAILGTDLFPTVTGWLFGFIFYQNIKNEELKAEIEKLK